MKRPSATRARLAKRVEEAFREQQGKEVYCDPHRIDFPRGFYRTDARADTYRWSAYCTEHGTSVGPSVDSYDTATDCARFGILLDKLPHNLGWEATADTDAKLLHDANSYYSAAQLEEVAK